MKTFCKAHDAEPGGTIRLYFTLEQAQTKLHRSR